MRYLLFWPGYVASSVVLEEQLALTHADVRMIARIVCAWATNMGVEQYQQVLVILQILCSSKSVSVPVHTVQTVTVP